MIKPKQNIFDITLDLKTFLSKFPFIPLNRNLKEGSKLKVETDFANKIELDTQDCGNCWICNGIWTAEGIWKETCIWK